jgi:hypothetical protein
MPKLIVSHPPADLVVAPGQPFVVSGQASDVGLPEPRLIDSVTVQVDSGPVIEATLTRLPGTRVSAVVFKALAQVTSGGDPHVVTVTATNDNARSVRKTVTIFTGPVFEVRAPGILLEIASPVPLDLADPRVDTLVGQLQQALVPMSKGLAALGLVLAGPNLVSTSNAAGTAVLRLGLWIEDQTFPVLPAQPPAFPLPRLSPTAATACFDVTPLLPTPPPSGLTGGFAVAVPGGTLQRLVDAVAPAVKAAAGGDLESITVTLSPPGSVATTFSGHKLGVPFTLTATEMLGTVPVTGASPSQSVPAVLGTSYSSSVGGILDWLIGLVIPVFGIVLLAARGIASGVAGEISDQLNGVIGPLIAGIPGRIPFANTALPIPFLPDFPAFVPDWTFFGVSAPAQQVLGTGTLSIQARDQTIAGVAVSGPGSIIGYQQDLAGGAGQTYRFTLTDLAPDPGRFSWAVSGAGSSGGPISVAPFTQSGNIGVEFPLPLHIAPGTFHFTLTVEATETCGTDPTKTLQGTATRDVRVEVKQNPEIPP